MNIAIVTIAYNGYGRFVDQWLGAIAELDTLPAQVVVALGKDHGCNNTEELLEKYAQLNLQFHHTNVPPLMGSMRNAAVNETNTEWVMYLSVDDVILPKAIDEFSRYQDIADCIVISWLSRATWDPKKRVSFHQGKTPEYMFKNHGGRGFLVAHSPYRRKFWEMEPYMAHDYPNAPFYAGLVMNGARFVKTDEPCTMYLQRKDSHARVLGRRGPGTRIPEEKRQANYWKAYLEGTIRSHYGAANDLPN